MAIGLPNVWVGPVVHDSFLSAVSDLADSVGSCIHCTAESSCSCNTTNFFNAVKVCFCTLLLWLIDHSVRQTINKAFSTK